MRTLEDLIEEAIKAEAEKLTLRFQSYHNRIERIHQQNRARLKEAPSKILTTPPYWSVSKTFNPFYVHKHARAIARSVTKKIREGTYSPRTPQSQNVPKLGGGTRIVNIFEIPDAAVSNFYFRKLLSKNRHRFSPYAYAYRDDRNVHFAVQDIHVDIKRFSRLFVAEYDFSDFFGSIQHDYLLKQLSENGFFIAPVEQRIIESFLALKDQRGIPQGTSLSLFLANLACWRLDRDFLDDGLKFARYADDTVIWSPHYDRICRAAERIAEFSRYTGVAINPYKSSGISLLVKRGFTSEFKQTKDHIEFLGYRLSSDDVSIKAAAVQRIKRNISYTLYHHLIQPLKGRELRALRIPANDEDRDLVVAVSTIRRYLYGNLTEDLLKAYLAGRYDRMTFKGLMSFYPLVTDEQQLRALDGWLVSTIFRCVQLRSRLLKKWNQDRSDRFPFNATRSEFLRRCRSMLVNNKPLYEIPSFLRIHQAVQKRLLIGGVEETIDPSADAYQYQFD